MKWGGVLAEYYKHEIAKWNVATDDLTLEQEAAYHRVVGMIRLYERPFRHNLRVLSGMWRCNERRASRILNELIEAGKLRIEDGFIIDEKAVDDASKLRQSRVDKQSAGRQGGIESGKSRRKSLENNNTDEAPASTREEKAREEKTINGGGGSACATEAEISAVQEPTTRERILAAMGVGPDGVAGPSKFIGGQGDMAEAQRWLDMPGMTVSVIEAEIVTVMARRTSPPSTFSYFTPAMQRLSASLSSPALQPTGGQSVRPSPPKSNLEAIAAKMQAEFAARDAAE